MDLKVKEEKGFKYYEEGEGDVLLLLHGLFGALSNFVQLIEHFSKTHKVVLPILPLYELPLEETRLPGFVKFIEDFVAHKKYDSMIILGNSLGGHLGLLYALQNLDKTKAMILTGSSGLFEKALGDTYPKRGSYEFVKEKTEYTFYNPEVATKELVDEVYDIVNNRDKAIRVLYTARSAIRNNLGDELHNIKAPTLLLWGKQDNITPLFVGEEFAKLLPNSELVVIDKCGHAPMMETPDEFNRHLDEFLKKL